jgi:Tfp pilus assembly protein PilO
MADLKNTASLQAGLWLKSLYPIMKYRMRLVPWPIATGIFLLTACLPILLFVILPQKYALDQLEQNTARLHREMPKHQSQKIDHSPQASLNTFYRSLPPETEAPRLIEALLKSAADNGIVAEKAEYQLTRSSTAHFSRYQITLPVHADYIAVRKFSTQVLNTMPNAALNEISFRRDESKPGQVEARLRFTLYMSRGEQ